VEHDDAMRLLRRDFVGENTKPAPPNDTREIAGRAHARLLDMAAAARRRATLLEAMAAAVPAGLAYEDCDVIWKAIDLLEG